MILVLALRACTKAPRNGAPSGPVTVPVTVAASAADTMATSPNIPKEVHIFMTMFPHLKFLIRSALSIDALRRRDREDSGGSVPSPLRGRDREGGSRTHRIFRYPPPHPSPARGEGADRVCYSASASPHYR